MTATKGFILGLSTLFVFCSSGCGPSVTPGQVDAKDVTELEYKTDAELETSLELPDIDIGDADAEVPPDVELFDVEHADGEVEEAGEVEAETPNEIEHDELGPNLCANPCTNDDDCQGVFEDLAVCEQAKCIFNPECKTLETSGKICQVLPIPGCCVEDSDCDDGNVCTIDHCLGNKCDHAFDENNPECCQDKLMIFEDFEDMPLGDPIVMPNIDFIDEQSEDNVKWSIVLNPCGEGKALYFGDPVCKTYYSGQLAGCKPVEDIDCTVEQEEEICPPPKSECSPDYFKCIPEKYSEKVSGKVVLKEVELPADSLIALSFKLRLETEETKPGLEYVDLFSVRVLIGATLKEVPYDTHEIWTTNGNCVTIAADLSAFAGQTVNIELTFASDDVDNFHEGIYLDDIRLATFCKQCNADMQCDDGDKCTIDTCPPFANIGGSSGFCLHEKPDPCCMECSTDQDCEGQGCYFEDDPFCWLAECEQGLCQWQPNPACCTQDMEGQVYHEGFESCTLSGTWQVKEQSGSAVIWGVGPAGACNPSGDDPDFDDCAIYFGNPASGTYDCGEPQCFGEFITGPIALQDVDKHTYLKLTFMLNMSTEWDAVPQELYPQNNAHMEGIDVLYVYVITQNQEEIEVWNSDSIYGTTHGECKLIWVDLSEFIGQQIRLKFRFDSGYVFPANNEYGGIYVDEIELTAVCEQVCEDSSDCPPGPECTEPVCYDGKCNYPQIEECCTETVNFACDDGDDCTIDECDLENNVCKHNYVDDPSCCTPYDGIFVEDFSTSLGELFQYEDEGEFCGDGQCVEMLGEDCSTCKADCGPCLVDWVITDNDYHSAPLSLYFGNPAVWNFDAGAQKAYGKIVTVPFELPPFGVPLLSFWTKLDTQNCGLPWLLFVEPVEYDVLHIYVQTAEGNPNNPTWSEPVEIWNSMSWDMKGCTWDPDAEQVVWKKVTVGMKNKGLEGKVIRLVFEFDSFDTFNNTGEGVYIDDVAVYTVCDPNYECSCAFECPETQPESPNCTIEQCIEGQCVPKPNELLDTCCIGEILAYFDFDSPCSIEGWKYKQEVGLTKWDVVNFKNKTEDGICSLYFGDPSTKTYKNGNNPAYGKISSPNINVTGYDKIKVSFWMWYDVEDEMYFLDYLTFGINTVPFDFPDAPPLSSEDFVIWQKPCSLSLDVECVTGEPQEGTQCAQPELGCADFPFGQWTYMEFEIDFTSPKYGELKQLAEGLPNFYVFFTFTFNSGDAEGNTGLGVVIDDFKVMTECD